ncbi:MAG: right-handed parallel beta-helix repeat-containing protein [Rubrivivax sp.]|nr:right-handed parallel beta-helix repeat-containing protein [Rubrivivax sp.]
MSRAWACVAACAVLAACGDGSDENTAAGRGGSPAAGSPVPSPAPTPTPSPAPAPAPQPASWVECAKEHQTCSFDGLRKVRYGTEASNVTQTRTSGLLCNNNTFGSDPAVGVLKTCWVETVASSTPSPAPAPAPTPAPAPAPAPTPTPAPSPAPAPGQVGPRVSTFTASGPITASMGQLISGVRITNPNGPCITIPAGATGVVVRDSDIGPCGGNANIFIEGANATVEYTFVHHGNRGVMAHRTSGTTTRFSRFDTFYGPKFNGTAIEYDYMASGRIEGNVVRGSNYASDAISVFESSNMTLVNNDIDINVAEPSAAAFTMGDATNGNPGANNYVAGNIVKQSGGVPAGVFGSSGNTVLEKNCLTAGIQAYNYAGTFVGVTVRNNVINLAASFVPDPGVIAGWSSNINSTDCSRLPQ